MNETLADIVAGMRRHIQAARDYPQDIDITAGDVEDWADRLEAAAKRERGALVAEAEAAKDARNRVAVRLREEYAKKCKECKSKPGNIAAMRAALEDVVHALCHICICGAACEKGLEKPCAEVKAARAALSAPARNCDVGTADEVSAYWGANVHAVPLHGDAYAMRIDGREFATFLDWLMAPAKEGGAECKS